MQQRQEALLAVATHLAAPLVGATDGEPERWPADAPLLDGADGGGGSGGLACFPTFLARTLERPVDEVRQLAADGPDNWSTRIKEATYRGGHQIGKALRDAGVPV